MVKLLTDILRMLLSVGLMSIYLEAIVIRLPYSNRKIRLFGQFPYLLSITWVWLLCAFLTVTDIEPKDSPIRTDRNLTITDPSWFNLPHPGKNSVDSKRIVATQECLEFLASTQVSLWVTWHPLWQQWSRIWETTICWPESPDKDLLPRKLSVEASSLKVCLQRYVETSSGLGSLLSSSMGIGTAVTTDSQNIALIHFTKI